MPVQWFLAYRIKILSRSWVIFGGICLLSLAQGGCGVAGGVLALMISKCVTSLAKNAHSLGGSHPPPLALPISRSSLLSQLRGWALPCLPMVSNNFHVHSFVQAADRFCCSHSPHYVRALATIRKRTARSNAIPPLARLCSSTCVEARPASAVRAPPLSTVILTAADTGRPVSQRPTRSSRG